MLMRDEMRAFRITVGITALVLLLAGGASASAGWFINDNAKGGDCTSIGTWNVASKTCTLTIDLTKTIEIDSDGITLDGNGHTITGSSYTTGKGTDISGRNGVTIKNTNVRNFFTGINLFNSRNNMLSGNNALNNSNGIVLWSSSNNTLSSNNANSNKDSGIALWSSSNNTLISNNANSNNNVGIFLDSSGNNTLLNNTMTANSFNFVSMGRGDSIEVADSYFNNQIDYSNTVDGKPIYYVKNAKDTVYDSSTNAGTFYCIGCINVTIKNMKLLKNEVGIFFWNTTFSKIQNVNVSNNGIGIYLVFSNNNMLSGNNASNNDLGIGLIYSSNNTLSSNNANSNNNQGINLDGSSNNTLSNNNANSNNQIGLFLDGSSNNSIYNNFFNNTKNFGIVDWSSDNWNTTKTSNTNIVGGPYLGGNFWAYPNGTGFSQTCADSNSDGICDSTYTLDSNNIDYLPLAYKPAFIDKEVTLTATPAIPAETTKAPTASPTEKTETTKTPTTTMTEKASGFELVLAITTLSAVYLFWRKRR